MSAPESTELLDMLVEAMEKRSALKSAMDADGHDKVPFDYPEWFPYARAAGAWRRGLIETIKGSLP